MPFKISHLWVAPEVNPLNGKARSIPILNPINKYGRTFFFSWSGFLVAFLSWYAFPPLLTLTIRKDLHMSQNEYANSNITGLIGTLVIRLIAGPLCDKFGPRYVFVGCLLAGAIPTAMAGLVTSPTGIIVLRFFIGVLGASFVPCQVWSTGFFDKNVVGTSNALAGGWGNSGGGITYFVMPAIFDSLVKNQGLTPHVAWRVAFIVPFVIITAIAMGILFTGEDCPAGKWENRHQMLDGVMVANSSHNSIMEKSADYKITPEKTKPDPEALNIRTAVDRAEGEVVVAPTLKEGLSVLCSLQTLALALPYACSFGGELAINSIIGSYYLKNFPHLLQTGSGRWAAMFGLLNVFFRSLGGVVADIIYKYTGSVWGKKMWLVFCGVTMGCFELAIGLLNPHHEATMFGLVAGLAVFMDAANGANFAVVPHVHPFANGILSGLVGATGNLGGIIFAIIFRYNGKNYNRVIWIIGVISISVNLSVSWIRPVPRRQIGGQ
ncbi:probable high affinity nitrate transporter NrtB [Rhynchosporium agropyri]|uniref:Nitrate/nitrite transporter n=1 Tax=Rhynchosporium agropyri TaxID=914238 RepID=A0A1E1KB15_9HELO|nr:probable high affinity nitrate transporter NrtB [Rhynchosporium agropyri]